MTRTSLFFSAFFAMAACGGSSSTESSTTPSEDPGTETAGDNGATPAQPEATTPVGSDLGAAPDFELTDIEGNQHTLAQYRGKFVVLEWFNPGCPFVKYAYGDGPMRALQTEQLDKGDVVWLSINSGGPGKQGHGVEANKAAYQAWGMKHPLLIDESGTTGRAYGAKSTPHMFVVDKAGQLLYRGALDNAPLGKLDGDAKVDHVTTALESARAGSPVEMAETASYGCSVKYGDS